jgi:hypothetical protein
MGTINNSLIQKMGTVTNSMIQNSGCWLLFPSLWIRLLINIPIILDQAISYCSEYFGSGSLLLFPLFWMKLLSTFPIILEMERVTNSLIKNNGNSNQQPDPK